MMPNPDEQKPAPDPKLLQAMQLISALCDESITDEQRQTLQDLVCDDAAVRKFYVRMMHLHAGLYYFASALPGMTEPSIADDAATENGMNESLVMPALNQGLEADDEEQMERFLPAPVILPAPEPVRPTLPVWIKGVAAIVVLGIGTAVFFAIPSSSPRLPSVVDPTRVAVAPSTAPSQIEPPALPHFIVRRELEYQPVWEQPPAYDTGFVSGETLSLRSGCVQLTLANSGSLVVEGPAHLTFQSESELTLRDGRLVARYPGGGLVINCPHGTVQDLGTRFGVEVTAGEGNSDIEVFEGKVSATVLNPATTRSVVPFIVKAGEAAVMDRLSLVKSPEGSVPQRFITELASPSVTSLDVIDLICGGNGTSHRRGTAVDSITGEIGNLTPSEVRKGDGAYHKVANWPVIDGAFVPDGSHDSNIVDSAGDRFTFPATTNQAVNQIRTGGDIPWFDSLGISTTLSGTDYSKGEHGLICTHADNALTLNLDAVRRLYPGRQLIRFRSLAGNSYENEFKRAPKINPAASLFVLVDGKKRFEKPGFTNLEGSFSVDVPLQPADRFLTLAALDDGKDIYCDWILWADAKLDLSPAK